MKIFISIILSFFIFTGCGYKPTATYASKAISGKTYVNVNIDIDNAANSVLLKDAIIELLIGKFGVQITTNKNDATSFIEAKLKSVSQTLIQTDTQGFAKVYRENVTVEITYYQKNKQHKTFTLSNYYDFTVDNDSSVTQTKKDEAVKIAISKALVNIFSKIAVDTFK